MQFLRKILSIGLLVLIGGFFLLSPYLYGIKQGAGRYDNVPDSPFAVQILSNGYNSNILQVRLTSGTFFTACFLEKILSYSSHREKYLSNVTDKPFPQYIINFLDTPWGYYVYSLRKIII